MSSSSTGDDEPDDFDLPAVDDDVVSTGAAADSSDWDERLKGLPRLLRYAMLVSDSADHVEQRLMAEIDELCPNLPLNAAWAAALDAVTGRALATELDHRAVIQNEPVLRSLADSVRLLCLPVLRDASFFEEYRRVGKALLHAFKEVALKSTDEQLCCDIERFVFGWAALPASTDLLSKNFPAAPNAAILGMRMAEHRIAAARATVRRQLKEEETWKEEREAEAKATELPQGLGSRAAEAIPDHHLVVARLSKDDMKSSKLKETMRFCRPCLRTSPRSAASTKAGCHPSTAPSTPLSRAIGAGARCAACAVSSRRCCANAIPAQRGISQEIQTNHRTKNESPHLPGCP